MFYFRVLEFISYSCITNVCVGIRPRKFDTWLGEDMQVCNNYVNGYDSDLRVYHTNMCNMKYALSKQLFDIRHRDCLKIISTECAP